MNLYRKIRRMDEFLRNNIHILPSSHKKLIIKWINVTTMMQNDDLIHLIATQCDIETHLMLRKTCKRFYHQLIKPLTIDDAFERHLIDVELGLMQLVKLMKDKFDIKDVRIESDWLNEICVYFDMDDEKIKCESISISLLSGHIKEGTSVFDIKKLVESAENEYEKNGFIFGRFDDICFNVDSEEIHPNVKSRKKLFKKYTIPFDLETYADQLNQKIQCL